MALDKGQKVTSGVATGAAVASLIVWVLDEMLGIPISFEAALGMVAVAAPLAGVLVDRFTEDDA